MKLCKRRHPQNAANSRAQTNYYTTAAGKRRRYHTKVCRKCARLSHRKSRAIRLAIAEQRAGVRAHARAAEFIDGSWTTERKTAKR